MLVLGILHRGARFAPLMAPLMPAFEHSDSPLEEWGRAEAGHHLSYGPFLWHESALYHSYNPRSSGRRQGERQADSEARWTTRNG